MTALPRMLRELADIVGEAGALEIASSYGGQRFYVPLKIDAGHPIAARVGLANARALCSLYGGENLTLPLGPAGTIGRARQVLAKALEEGVSANEAARRSGFTSRTVHAHRRAERKRATRPQRDLFE